jgi:hypothetical protein
MTSTAEAIACVTAATVTHPNFFLVGASRSGTTSLWHHLRQHPQVHMPTTLAGKEPSFFCDLTPPWALDYRTYDSYLTLFARGRGYTAVGDASTGYLVAPESAGRIHERYPHARIIITLRNPVQRAYSLYRFLCYWGMETSTSFEKALDREPSRLGNEAFQRETALLYYAFLYFNSGLYSSQIERYYSLFGRDRVQVVLFDDLKEDAVQVAGELYRFLDVAPDYQPEVPPQNGSEFPLSIRVQRLLCRDWNAHPLSPRKPIRRRDRLHYPTAIGINVLLGRYRSSEMSPETRRKLTNRFRDDIEKTAALIGRNLDSWLEVRKAK